MRVWCCVGAPTRTQGTITYLHNISAEQVQAQTVTFNLSKVITTVGSPQFTVLQLTNKVGGAWKQMYPVYKARYCYVISC